MTPRRRVIKRFTEFPVTHFRKFRKSLDLLTNLVRKNTEMQHIKLFPTLKYTKEMAPWHGRMNSADQSASIQSNKWFAIERFFRDRRFSRAPEQSIDNLIRDFEICPMQQSLDPSQMSLFLFNAVADPARHFFLTNGSSSMSFE